MTPQEISCIGLPSWEGFWGSGFQKVESRGHRSCPHSHRTPGIELSTSAWACHGDPLPPAPQLWTWSQETDGSALHFVLPREPPLVKCDGDDQPPPRGWRRATSTPSDSLHEPTICGAAMGGEAGTVSTLPELWLAVWFPEFWKQSSREQLLARMGVTPLGVLKLLLGRPQA